MGGVNRQAVIEGNGAEVARYAQDHPDQYFQLLAVEGDQRSRPAESLFTHLARDVIEAPS